MFVTEFFIRESREYPLLVQQVYQQIAEQFDLPAPELLLKSIKSDVTFNVTERNQLEVYFLDNLVKADSRDLFQIRFAYSQEARKRIAIFLSFGEDRIARNITIQFPGRAGRVSFSYCLSALKDVAKQLQIHPRAIEFEIEGFREDTGAYVHEHSLSAFVWIEVLGRYGHVRENLSDEIRRKLDKERQRGR